MSDTLLAESDGSVGCDRWVQGPAGAAPSPDAVAPLEPVALEAVHSVGFGDGEAVIFKGRCAWSVDLIIAALAGAAVLLVGAAMLLALGAVGPTARGVIWLGAGGAFIAAIPLRFTSLYVLTDRRVLRRGRRGLRLVWSQMPLVEIDRVQRLEGPAESALGLGTIEFRGEEASLTWRWVAEPERVHEIAVEAINRYGKWRRRL